MRPQSKHSITAKTNQNKNRSFLSEGSEITILMGSTLRPMREEACEIQTKNPTVNS